MSLAVVYSRAQLGIRAPLVTVEVHLANGLPALSIVGLPETAVRESKDRVRGAILNSRFEFPSRRITINLAPADLPKEGGRYDLPIALGILAASGQVSGSLLESHEFVGELALSGAIRPVRGVLPTALAAKENERSLVVPSDNASEAALLDDGDIRPATHLLEVCAHLAGQQTLALSSRSGPSPVACEAPDLADVRGQLRARRALEVAAAGGHSLLMIGPPGTGKTLLASRLPGILPPMDEHEAQETAAIASISANGFDSAQWRERPFRSPHHTASAVALVGGGSNPQPGEISLAHNGVLFLDELPEFDRRVLEVLREPLEKGSITISRAARQAEYPARFQLVAAMNPCPCGYLGDESGKCSCTAEQVQRYKNKISGPLLDRIDIQIEVPRVPFEELDSTTGEPSEPVRIRALAARRLQLDRQGRLNTELDNRALESRCALSADDRLFIRKVIDSFHLSARAYHRILKVARTIADLSGSDNIETTHLAEAIGYRCLDRRRE